MTNLVIVANVIRCLLQLEGDGVNGDAVGPLQIKPGVVENINFVRRKEGRREWKLSRRENKGESIVMAMEYMLLYEQEWWTADEYAALWRMGPKGMKENWSPEESDYMDRFRNLYKKESGE